MATLSIMNLTPSNGLGVKNIYCHRMGAGPDQSQNTHVIDHFPLSLTSYAKLVDGGFNWAVLFGGDKWDMDIHFTTKEKALIFLSFIENWVNKNKKEVENGY